MIARLAIAAALAVFAADAHADIVIGVAAPLVGELAPLGTGMRDGVAQAVADINAAGGVAGQQLVVEAVDDGCNAKKADAVANQLAGKGAALVVGHLCLQASLAGAAVYAAEHIVEISPATTSDRFTGQRAGPGIFRLAGRDDAEGAFIGSEVAARFPNGNVAIADDGTDYGKALADGAASALTASGHAIAVRDTYAPGNKDYSGLAARLAAASVDALVIGGSDPEAGMIASAARAQGLRATVLGGDALYDEDYGRLAGDAAEGTRMAYPSDGRNNPAAAKVVAEFAAGGSNPAGYVLPSYAAVQVWAAAASAAGSTDFDKVAAAIQSGTFHTVLGDLSFDAHGDVRSPAYDWHVWHDGAFVAAGM